MKVGVIGKGFVGSAVAFGFSPYLCDGSDSMYITL